MVIGGIMRNLRRFAAACTTTALLVGILGGCDSKKYNVSYDYDSGEYINIGEYTGVEVELGDYTVTDENLQNVIDQIVKKYVNYSIIDREAKEGDQVLLNFDAYISGNKVGGFSGEDYELVLGSNSFLVEGFEEQIMGLSAGDKRAVTGLKIPDTFTQEASYAGRSVTFDVEVLGVYEPVYPDYTDDFVNAISDGKYATTAEYDQMLIGQLEDNAVINRYNDKYDILLDKIVASTDILKEFPEEYVTKKEEEITRTAEFYSGLYDYSTDEYIQKQYGAENAREAAENIIMLEFIFQEIIKKENFTVTEKYYKDNLMATASKRGYTTTERLVSDYMEDGVVKLMLMDMAEDFIMNSAVEISK